MSDYKKWDTGGLPTVSVSAIETYLKCPLSFKLGYIDKIRGESTEEQTFGTTVHGCMESVYNWIVNEEFSGKVPDEVVLQSFKEAFFKHMSENDLVLYNDGLQMVRRYFRSHGDIDHRNIVATERRFVIKMSRFAIIGVIDKVEKDRTDAIEITDYKTSKRLYSDEDLKESLQGTVYLLAGLQLWPWATSINFGFEMLKHDQRQPIERTASQIQDIVPYIDGLYDRMYHSRSYSAKLNVFCPWCGQKEACQPYKDLLKLPANEREPMFVDSDADFSLIAQEYEKFSAMEQAAKKAKNKCGKVIKRAIQDSDLRSVKANGRVYKIFGQKEKCYDPDGVFRVLREHVGEVPPSYISSIDEDKLKKIVEDQIPDRARRAMIQIELDACAKQVKKGAEFVTSSVGKD